MLFLIDTAYDRVSWHGPNLRGSLRGMTPALAAWRPGPDRHNIWELIVHAAYWKYVAWRRLTGAKRGSFPLAGSNFIARPVAETKGALQADLDLLDQMHREFISQIFETHANAAIDLQVAVQLALIGRFYERLGDHAVNISKRVVYIATGWVPEHASDDRHRAQEVVEAAAEAGADVGPEHPGDPAPQ